MQTKSAQQIQAELKLIRLAYRDREARLENLNRYLAEPCPLARATPVLLCAAVVISGLCWFIGFLCL